MKEEQKGPRWRSRKGKHLLPLVTGWGKESVDALMKVVGFLRSHITYYIIHVVYFRAQS